MPAPPIRLALLIIPNVESSSPDTAVCETPIPSPTPLSAGLGLGLGVFVTNITMVHITNYNSCVKHVGTLRCVFRYQPSEGMVPVQASFYISYTSWHPPSINGN
ncbi:hypothetical protein H4582DRAFT_2019984 [Lactarius indigo]|nr:hypothetical protein H4582DRAFT_2019984 [Lactarius indigo]